MTTFTPYYRPRYQVPPPPLVARRYTLLSAAQIVPGEDGSLWEQGVEYWTTACDMATGFVDGWCAPKDESGEPTEWDKDIRSFDPQVVTGDPFTVNSGIACQSPVFNAVQAAEALLEQSEFLQVEQQFWLQQMARADLLDLGDGGVFGLDDALGVLEAEAAVRYAGQLFIHVPVHALAMLLRLRLAERAGTQFTTPSGSVLVPGAGYKDALGPGGERPPSTGYWVLATGQVQIRRSPVFTNSAFDVKKNRQGAIAERTYVITADCFAAAIRVDPCKCTPTTSDGGDSATAQTEAPVE
ncbi:hypothetical protein [Streptacidiphilus cavernicola]|uniref:Phage major capsid protein n=1 Tax=Streptacidiphilus cavernicola TaxID=3342716 RepID=A0ABV6VYD8_9ACTN